MKLFSFSKLFLPISPDNWLKPFDFRDLHNNYLINTFKVSSHFWTSHLWAFFLTWATKNPPIPHCSTSPKRGDAGPWLLKRSEFSGWWQMGRYCIYNKYFVNKLPTLSLYQKNFINSNIVNKVKCIYWFNYKTVLGSQRTSKC